MKRSATKVTITALLLLSFGCEKATEVESITDPRTPAGEIVIDTFQVWVSPDSARWSFAFHFVNRPGTMTDFEMDVEDRRIAARYITISLTPPPQDRMFSQSGQASLSTGKVPGDSITAECFLAWHVYDPDLGAYPPNSWVTRRFTKRFPVLTSLP